MVFVTTRNYAYVSALLHERLFSAYSVVFAGSSSRLDQIHGTRTNLGKFVIVARGQDFGPCLTIDIEFLLDTQFPWHWSQSQTS